MKKVFLSFLLCLFTISTHALTARTSQSHVLASYYLVVNAKSPKEMSNFTKVLNVAGYDIAGTNWKSSYVEIVTTEPEIQKLAQRGFPGLLKIVRVARTRALDPQYLNPDKVEAELKQLSQKYPQHTRLERIGTSLLGRPIWALLISATPNMRTPAYHTKPSMLFDGLHHAREVMTPEVVMDVAHFALQGLTQRSQGTEFLSRWNLWIVPMLNVDGSDIVWKKNSFWRKNARSDSSGRMHGVDVNRNYAFGWNKCRGSSPSPIAQDYRGASAGSEPETQALMNLAQMIRPVAYVSYHSFGELTLYPYGCQGVLTGENQLISQVATEVSQILPADDNRGTYTPGTPWQILYAVDGDSMSYMFGEFGAVSMTFEINQDFQPPYALKAPTVAKHRKAWAYLLNRYDQGMLKLRVLDGRTRTPAQAVISVSNIPFLQGEKPYRTNGLGHFFKVLIPGSYTLTAQLPDGRMAQMHVNMKAGGVQADLVIP